MEQRDILQQATAVLKSNSRKLWTVPSGDLYPHQWLWDSCFIAIGLRHLDVERAKTEVISLSRGQWSNGMLPNMIFAPGKAYRRDRNLWRSWINPYSPDKVATSGITQPPLLAEAVVRVGEKLTLPERRTWYKQMYPSIVAYHQWIYNERDPHQEGLAVLLHPYESGMDSSPYWLSELRRHSMPFWVAMVEKLHLAGLANFFRRDTQHVPVNHRMDNIQAMAYWAALHRLRRKAYNSQAILGRPLFAVEDLVFNSILIRANEHLQTIAKIIGSELPPHLIESAKKSPLALGQLWDEITGQYYSRSFISRGLIEVPTIATLLPLYAGSIDKQKAERLVELLKSSQWFGSKWPIPSVPLNSPGFDSKRYWQGPAWINMNWLIIDGLSRNGFKDEAELLKTRTLELVQKSGMSEYFNPKTGEAVGAPNFSWTAALTIDLLKP